MVLSSSGIQARYEGPSLELQPLRRLRQKDHLSPGVLEQPGESGKAPLQKQKTRHMLFINPPFFLLFSSNPQEALHL